MTKQSIFNKVYRHFVHNKGAPSFVKKPSEANPSGITCQYRGPDGARCAAGLLIPNKLYRRSLEGDGILVVTDNFPAIADHLGSDNLLFVESIQKFHDWSAEEHGSNRRKFRKQFKESMRLLADREGLTLPSKN